MKTTSASQSGSITARLSTAALIVLAGMFLGVFAAAGPFQSLPSSDSEAGPSPPSAFASNAIQRFSGRSGLVEGFNGSPKGVHGPFPTIQLQQVATGFTSPVTVANAGDGTGRLFIVQQTGEIRILINGTVLPTPFLDISDLVGCGCGEQGLLGLAFHPAYANNGFFYVDYTDDDGNTQVARYTVSAGDPNVADPGSRHPILNQDQPFTNHNGGQLVFGPDGYLYIAFGDGGSGGDPQENGQDLTTWLGKILRVDIDGDDFPDPNLNYAVPPDNPFVGNPDALDEIWAYGVRNPWRCTFDRVTGDFFIADVGQGTREEIDFQPAASTGGENYGWDVLEGTFCHEDIPQGSCNQFLTGGSTLPVLEYSHAFGCAVTGGYRYRGQLYPQLDGIYFYSDLCSGTIWGATQDIQGRWQSEVLLESGLAVTTFGEDEGGEVYVIDYSAGVLYQIIGQGSTPTPTPTVTATPTPTATSTPTTSPSPTATSSVSPTVTPRPTPTARPEVTPRPRPTPAPRPAP